MTILRTEVELATKEQLDCLAAYVIDNKLATKQQVDDLRHTMDRNFDRVFDDFQTLETTMKSYTDAKFDRVFTELAEIKAKLP